jgi:hypothetical protein
MNIQDKMQEIHHKFGVTEKANYEIQLFVDDLIKKDRAEQLILHGVSNCALFENEKLVSNMCISFRHDFGLLPKLIQEDLKRDCKEWLRAYDNNKEHCC